MDNTNDDGVGIEGKKLWFVMPVFGRLCVERWLIGMNQIPSKQSTRILLFADKVEIFALKSER